MIAIIPLKGHSERVKNKNIREIANKPLFFHIVESLKKSEKVEKTIINTDSDTIADLAVEEFGDFVEISMRTQELCGDFVSVNKIIEYEVNKGGYSDDQIFIQTHATNPLLRPNTISAAFEDFSVKYNNQECDSMFSVTEFYSRFYSSNFKAINHNPSELIRTQDLDPVYEENSNFYIFTKIVFNKNKKRIGDTPALCPMNRHEALDIDTEEDWCIVDLIIRG